MEQTEVFDDSLLPDAKEIEQLHNLDPNILEWLKTRAEKEQEFRHKSYSDKVELIDCHNKREHDTNRIALYIYFVLVAGCLGASFMLLMNERNVEGSIFGGVSVILALAVLITRRQPKQPVKEQEE